MKKINITLIAVLFAITGIFANNNPLNEKNPVPFEIISGADQLVSFEMDVENNQINFETANEINFLQVLKEDGTLEYQLPVMSNSINIDLEEFENGEYQVNLLISNDTMVSSTFRK